MNIQRKVILIAGLTISMTASANATEKLLWGVQGEQLEQRYSDNGEELTVWDARASIGYDEGRLVYRTKAEYNRDVSAFETLENHLLLQVPISDFFDSVAGVRLDTPENQETVYGVIGLHGLAKQWIEIDLDLYLSEDPSLRFEADYEGLITNRITFIPSIELELPMTKDQRAGLSSWGPRLELGARLSYDLIDRTIAPYIGVNYEHSFGDTGRLVQAEGGSRSATSFVIGTRFLF